MERNKPRVALLIDADNAPAAHIDAILAELATYGETNLRRAYGNWKKTDLKGWEEVLHERLRTAVPKEALRPAWRDRA